MIVCKVKEVHWTDEFYISFSVTLQPKLKIKKTPI